MKRLVVLTVMIVMMGATRAEAYYPGGFMEHYFGSGFGGYGYGYNYGYGYGRNTALVGTVGVIAAQVNRDILGHQERGRIIGIAEREQDYQHQQQSCQKQVVYVVPAAEKQQQAENKKLSQEIEKLKLEIKKLELQLQQKNQTNPAK